MLITGLNLKSKSFMTYRVTLQFANLCTHARKNFHSSGINSIVVNSDEVFSDTAQLGSHIKAGIMGMVRYIYVGLGLVLRVTAMVRLSVRVSAGTVDNLWTTETTLCLVEKDTTYTNTLWSVQQLPLKVCIHNMQGSQE